MGSFSVTHWLIFLAVVVVIFGTSKLKNAGKDLGAAVKGFKDAVRDENQAQIQDNQNRVIEHANTTTINHDKNNVS
ncbi:twin arginine translocase protein A [Moraxella macacae 0408225]|uniref:Sec-independent protein translocase protein TatA n=1 Tax=Moraxella macacae 0408225 TaxID=1230338 RepID=L2F7E8_9GAMM|nr:Sec-independent protein translocase subunit TatA [Moraxella macacae]ELA08957.1 twin arginine translocase protein A [Moraxella macacae 0408225]